MEWMLKLLPAIGGGIVGAFIKELIDRWRRPVLQIEIKAAPPFRAVTQVRSNPSDPDGLVADAVFLRCRVVNVGRSTAKGCRVYLARLTRSSPKGRVVDSATLEGPVPLRWSLTDEYTMDLPPAVPHFADVVSCTMLDAFPLLQLHTKVLPNTFLPLLTSTAQPGTDAFRVELAATADGAVRGSTAGHFVWAGDTDSLIWQEQQA